LFESQTPEPAAAGSGASRTRAEGSTDSLIMAANRSRRWWARLPPRGKKTVVLLVVAPIQFLFLFGIGHLGHPSHYLGIEGAGGALFGVVAGILAGPFAGVAVALVGVLAYFIYLTDLGQSVDVPVIIAAGSIWLLASYAAGIAADVVRRRAASREKAISQALAEAVSARRGLERVARLAPTFYKVRDTSALPKAICDAALSTFESSSSSLYRLDGDKLALVGANPETDLHRPGKVFTCSDLPGLIEAAQVNSPEFESDVLSQPRSDYGGDMIRSLSTRSVLRIPINVSERETYLLVVGWQKPKEQLDSELIALARRFADQAAVALEKAEVDELHSRLEERLLPRSLGVQSGVRVNVRYRPGEQRLGIGGDFVDILPDHEQRLHFVIGDVSGRGPDAAALGAALRSSWRALTLAGTRLEAVLVALQKLLQSERREENTFSTILAGNVDPARTTLFLANAGHPPPILISGGARFVSLIPSLPLGFEHKEERHLTRVALPPSWSLVCYTDGLYEGSFSPGRRERYGLDRLLELFGRTASETLRGEDLDMIIDVVEKANGKRLPDDIAVLLLSSDKDPALPA
jgi:serine phosphatase RsbU (regulator of sigma subunit)